MPDEFQWIEYDLVFWKLLLETIFNSDGDTSRIVK